MSQQKKKSLISPKKSSAVKSVQLKKPAGVGNIMKKLDAEIKKSKEGKLPPAFKKKWLEALRSGRYKQVTCALADFNENKWEYCVLGVAAKIAGYKPSSFEANGTLDHDMKKIPAVIRDNANGGTPEIASTLMSMNDDEEKTFTQIADYIEKEL